MATPAPDTEILICPHCTRPNRVPAGRALTRSQCGACHQALSSRAPIEIDGNRLGKLVARDTGAFLVDVWAPWCGPCVQFAPSFAAGAEAFGDHVRFFKINADENGPALQPYGIAGIPTLLAWQGGRLVAQQAGAMSRPHFLRWIESTLGLPTHPSHQRTVP